MRIGSKRISRWALVGLAALVIASPADADLRTCTVRHPDNCDTANDLVWDRGFSPAVAKFLGNQKTEFLYDGGMLLDEMIQVLGGLPADDRLEFDGRFLFTACREHSCDEKGAAVLRKDGQIDALAIVWYPCTRRYGDADGCANQARMTIFMRDPTDALLIERLRTWITQEFSKSDTKHSNEQLGHIFVRQRPIPKKPSLASAP